MQIEIFRNLTYDVTMTPLLKTMGNTDLHETKNSKENDAGFLKMFFF